MYGDVMVWTKSRLGNKDIGGFDVTSKNDLTQFSVCSEPGDQYGPDVFVNNNGKVYVAYTDSQYGQQLPISLARATTPNISALLLRQMIPYPGPSKCGDRGTEYLTGDFNKDCYVDFLDFGYLASSWLEEGLGMDHGNGFVCDVPPGFYFNGKQVSLDLNGDCRINFAEFMILNENWLKNTDPANLINLNLVASPPLFKGEYLPLMK